MANSVKKSRRQLVIDIVIIILVAVFTILLILILNNNKETITTTTVEKDDSGSIVCKSENGSKNKMFEKDENPSNYTNEIRILMSNNKLDKISYDYNGTFDSSEDAKKVMASLHADYNIYLGEHRISQDTFSPSFSTVENDVKISLFGKSNDINSYTARLFFLESSEYNKVKTLSGEMLKKLYENKGFSCVFQK